MGKVSNLAYPAAYAAQMLVVELGKARGQFAAPGTRAGDYHDRSFSGYVFVGAVSSLAHDAIDVGGIAAGEAVGEDGDVRVVPAGP